MLGSSDMGEFLIDNPISLGPVPRSDVIWENLRRELFIEIPRAAIGRNVLTVFDLCIKKKSLIERIDI